MQWQCFSFHNDLNLPPYLVMVHRSVTFFKKSLVLGSIKPIKILLNKLGLRLLTLVQLTDLPLYTLFTRSLPKINHSGSTVRIGLEQNKFSKKITSTRDWIWDPRTFVALLLQSHAFPAVLIPIAWKTETLKIVT